MLRAAIDIGGTFTDVIVFDEETNSISVEKTPSTPDNPANGVLNGLEKVEAGIDDLDFFSHGSTVGTNALIERELPRIGLVTTEGFRDVLEIRDGTKEDIWDMYDDVAPPYVKRRDRLEVPERIDYSGEVLEPLDEAAAREVVDTLRVRGIETIAVSFINSYMNGEHEQRMEEIINEEYPEAFVCTSHEIYPEMFEHERTSTTVINAGLVPVVREYLTDLSDRLEQQGYEGDVLAMHSGGGVMTTDTIAYYAARIANSGPTAGAIAGASVAEQCGFENAIGLDMGGTSTDISLTYDGEIETTEEWAVEFGYSIMFPSTEIETIGAGGGSIAWIDDGGSLRVGPKSQGADPGPACYQRGGNEPTVTDANVILNWVDPGNFLGGDMRADEEPSRRVLEEKIADPLGLGLTEAAQAIEEISIANMCNAVRVLSTSKGYDPREFALVAFGGAGPLHAAKVAQQMNIPKVIIPPYPGINSALGCLLVDVEHDLSQTYVATLDEDAVDDIESEFRKLEVEVKERLLEEGIERQQMRVDRELKMRYAGTWRSLEIPCVRPFSDIDDVKERFHREHERAYAHSNPDQPIDVYGLRVTGKGVVAQPDFPELAEQDDPERALKGTRESYFEDAGGYVETDVYEREALGFGTEFDGPVIVEQMDSTVLVPLGTSASVDRTGNIVIDVTE